jgi:hypothetical protein
MNKLVPHIIEFDKIGESTLGFISIAEVGKSVPFNIKRVYWTYYTPQNITRGGHANIEKEMILVAVSGKIVVNTEMRGMKPKIFVLENPDNGLYIPKLCWHTMQYSHNAVQLVLASVPYNKVDYIRDYDQFKSKKS